MSRDEYLQSMNEGFIKDKLKKGWEKVKSMFKIGMKKIKDFIAIFDSEGRVFPVVSPQAVIDKFSGSEAVKVYAPKEISDLAVAAGGNGCEEKAVARDESDYKSDDVPTGEDYMKWVENGDYKNSVEYKNLQSMFNIVKESYNCTDDETKKIVENMLGTEEVDESWEGQKKARIKYDDTSGLGSVYEIDSERFADILNEMIEQRSVYGGKPVVVDGITVHPYRNLLVFGAPGIGKSTIPTQVVKAYNENSAVSGDPSKKICLISINCSLIQEGDFMMPTMPKEVNVVKEIEQFKDTFPAAAEYMSGLKDNERQRLEDVINASGQFKSEDAPKSWLPSYKLTGDNEVDKMLDDKANAGVYVDPEGNTVKTGGGGIILFDEFLRANPAVFNQMMNFFLERKMNNWVLGSKWAVIACSNRPVDDGFIEEVWKEWKNSPANRDRQSRVFILRPDPEDWKKWMGEHGADPFIMEFIFDPSSMVGKEYPRWHTTVRRGVNDSEQFTPVTPRRWADAMNYINAAKLKYRKKTGKKVNDVSELPEDEIDFALGGVFDKDFVGEILEWLRDHSQKVDVDAIMKDPLSVYLPAKFIDDPAGAGVLIQNLAEELKKRYGEKPEDISYEQLANIIIWLGRNYKHDINTVQDFIEKMNEYVFPKKSKYEFAAYIKANMVLNAAYPFSDLPEEIENFYECEEYEQDGEKFKHKNVWPKGSLETIKGYMKEFFPWRIEGDEIQFVDKLMV